MKAGHIMIAFVSVTVALMATINIAEAHMSDVIIPVEEETEEPHITLNETEPETESVTESVTEPETTAAQVQQTEPETVAAETESTKLIQLSEEEEQMLLKLAMAEAENQSTEGKALVMDVVLNRVESASFPDSVEGVIFQKNQFSPVSDGRYYKASPDSDCYEALELVESGWDESEGATYFCTGSSKWHNANLTKLFKYGSHVFYK